MPRPKRRIGRIVLFRVHGNPETLRPLLVVSENGQKVTGELFLDYEIDRRSDWVRQHLFYLPQKETRTTPVYSAEMGTDVGQWREK